MRVATVVGSSHSAPADVREFGYVGDVIAVNDAICYVPVPLTAAVSIHDDYLRACLAVRAARGLNADDVQVYSNSEICLPLAVNTSGLLALWIAAHAGYDEVRVLGISADSGGHFYDLSPKCSPQADYSGKFLTLGEDWREEMKKWGMMRVASGNLLSFFPRIARENIG